MGRVRNTHGKNRVQLHSRVSGEGEVTASVDLLFRFIWSFFNT